LGITSEVVKIVGDCTYVQEEIMDRSGAVREQMDVSLQEPPLSFEESKG
jgi:hypothetical protein